MHYCYFLKEILLQIKTFSKFLKSFDSSGIRSKLDMESHFHKHAYNMFHIYTIFLQIISLDDPILQWVGDIFHV